jgi:parvulin-like peptidyl-prolyl cis-trans isomerase-like protein
MRKSWLVCVLFGPLAWGQAQPAAPAAQSTPAPAQAAPASPAAAPKEAAPVEVPMSAAVITVKGVSCPEFSHAAPASTTAAGKTGATAGKTGAAAAAKKPTDCVITRAEFEKLAKALQQGPTPLNAQQKRTLANQLPSAIAMSETAKKKGLDKTEGYTETLKFVKMRILAQKMQDSVREDADKVPDAKIEKYYKDNPEAYEQFSLDRLFIPKNKQATAEEKEEAKEEAKENEKLTDEQQKAHEAAEKAKQEKGEQEMTELAETLRQRAVGGEDFIKLQKDAFEAAGTKVENPTVNLPKVRRTGLPPAHASVFELKVGEVSAVISDNGGHYIYKVVSKEVLPLDQVKEEIHNKLKGEQLKAMMDKYTNSYQAVTNEVYFGPAPPPGPARRPRMTPPGAPQGAAQPATPPAPSTPAQAPAPQAPAKPN